MLSQQELQHKCKVIALLPIAAAFYASSSQQPHFMCCSRGPKVVELPFVPCSFSLGVSVFLWGISADLFVRFPTGKPLLYHMIPAVLLILTSIILCCADGCFSFIPVFWSCNYFYCIFNKITFCAEQTSPTLFGKTHPCDLFGSWSYLCYIYLGEIPRVV